MTQIGILGSGVVGQALAAGFLKDGHDVMLGTREPAKLAEWEQKSNGKAGSFNEVAAFGQLLVLCCKGDAVEQVIELAGRENFSGKVLIDVTNPLKSDGGQPPALFVNAPDSLGAQVQKLLPDAKVVKALNSVTAAHMCNGELEDGQASMFIAGQDDAKTEVARILQEWNWDVIDLGSIEQAYLLEALALIWIRYGFLNNHWTHAFSLLRK